MTFKTGYWGEQAKERAKKRLAYFREYTRKRKLLNPEKVRKEKVDFYYRKYGRLPGECGENRVGTGMLGEKLANEYLKESIIVRLPTHDISWNGKKIEVKTAKANKSGSWRFSINKLQIDSDFIFFVCLDRESILVKKYLIPTSFFDGKLVKNKNPFLISNYNSVFEEFLVV